MRVKMGTNENVTTVPFTVSAKQHVSTEYNVFIHGDITDPADFIDALHVLSYAEENDVVVIHINSGGGSLDATDSFLDAIASCEARVVGKVTGVCASAATLILLACDEFYISPNAVLMVHAASYGYGGKDGDVADYVDFTSKQLDKLMKESYGKMFTEEEYQQMKIGRNFWMTPEEFVERVNREAAAKEAPLLTPEEPKPQRRQRKQTQEV